MDTWGDRMEDPGRGGSGQDPPAAVRAAPGSEETSPGPSLRGPWIHSWETVGSFSISSPCKKPIGSTVLTPDNSILTMQTSSCLGENWGAAGGGMKVAPFPPWGREWSREQKTGKVISGPRKVPRYSSMWFTYWKRSRKRVEKVKDWERAGWLAHHSRALIYWVLCLSLRYLFKT